MAAKGEQTRDLLSYLILSSTISYLMSFFSFAMIASRALVRLSRRISTTPVLAVPNTHLDSSENYHVPLNSSVVDKPDGHKTQHLEALFPPLRFSDELARRL